MSEIWDENFIGDERCDSCGEALLDCVCADDDEEYPGAGEVDYEDVDVLIDDDDDIRKV